MSPKTLLIACLLLLAPHFLFAQGLPEDIRGLHSILDDLFQEMLVFSSDVLRACKVIAGFAAVFYIGYRVWKHIANAEAIDFFPLLRPFVLTWCIIFFNQVIWLMEGVLAPTKAATQELVDETNASVERLIAKRQQEMENSMSYKMYGVNDGEGDRDVWMQYTHPDEIDDEGLFGGIGNDIEFAMSKSYYSLKNWFKDILSFLLQLLYETAALCINTLRTFNLLICAMLGPFVFALSVFDGFHHSLTVWLARYVNFYLWLPVANILGAMLGRIQEKMIEIDIGQVQEYGDTFFTTSDVGYLVFMLIGIVAYFTVPSMANLIVNAGGGSLITSKITNLSFGSANSFGSSAAMATGMAADAFGDQNLQMRGGYGPSSSASGYFRDKLQ
ncbi:conjugative transposon protein TraJ [Chitinophaga rhizosphaerae]|uniref:conjugative transposon protein TraJ n=1 Tax=Chitinophaga rhizosphaerae TaxID=1864947 RepID=UPI000F7FF3C7|nr:conjugative transposon protein TraJ [Chitinophaga rhizosphaerae]